MHKHSCYTLYTTSLAHPVTHIGQEDISGGLSVYGMLCVERDTIHPLPGNGGGGVTRHSAGQRERLSLIDCCYNNWLSDHSRRYCVCVCAHVHVYCTSMCKCVFFNVHVHAGRSYSSPSTIRSIPVQALKAAVPINGTATSTS